MMNKLDNSGFSLVELIIVIAIMGMLTGFVSLSISHITNAKVSRTAKELWVTLGRAKVLTLGKEQNTIECIFYHDIMTNTYKVKILQSGAIIDEKVICSDDLTVQAYFDSDATGYALSDIIGNAPATVDSGLHILYNRSSGSFIQNTNAVSGTVKTYCSRITFDNGTNSTAITLIGKTGKTFVE